MNQGSIRHAATFFLLSSDQSTFLFLFLGARVESPFGIPTALFPGPLIPTLATLTWYLETKCLKIRRTNTRELCGFQEKKRSFSEVDQHGEWSLWSRFTIHT